MSAACLKFCLLKDGMDGRESTGGDGGGETKRGRRNGVAESL